MVRVELDATADASRDGEPLGIEEAIASAELIAQALHSHRRLAAITAEYNAKLGEYAARIRSEYDAQIEDWKGLLAKAEGARLLLNKRYIARGKRMQVLQGQLTAAKRRK